MEKKRLTNLLSSFTAEKQYIQDGYYRIRQKTESIYELAFLVTDSCGASCVHPQITVEVKADTLVPLQLFDLGVQPTRHVLYDEETQLILELELEKLIKKFECVQNQK
ncbi:hypothetical protein [Vagococcus sp.]|uniref:hypothetical protein n=1 Tax=Vagococcus sp. TaxID=1933889 RepID=UPI003F9BDA1C